MVSVAQEMSIEERRTRLLKSLSAGTAEEMVVNFSHLAHALGMDKAERYILDLVGMDSLVKSDYSRKPKMIHEGLCRVNRLEVIEALKAAIFNSNKMAIDKAIKRR